MVKVHGQYTNEQLVNELSINNNNNYSQISKAPYAKLQRR